MEKEFNLSDKIWGKPFENRRLNIDDVKEFIKLLEIKIHDKIAFKGEIYKEIIEDLRKLAGDKLT